MKELTLEEIKATVKEQYSKSIEKRVRNGQEERAAENEAYWLAVGMIKAFRCMEAITKDEALDLVTDIG